MSIIHRGSHAAHIACTGRGSVRRGAVAARLAGGAIAAALLLGAPILATVTTAPAAADTICNPFVQVCLPNPDAPLGPWVPWAPEAMAPAGDLSPGVPLQIEVENIPAAPASPPANNKPVPGTMFIPDAAAPPVNNYEPVPFVAGQEGIAFEPE
jgi:hypothetical protein